VLAGGLLILGAGLVLVFDIRAGLWARLWPPWRRRGPDGAAWPAGAPARDHARSSGIRYPTDVDGES
jgi:hypothetical protein